MSGPFLAAVANNTTRITGSTRNDVEIGRSPTDFISSLAFSPQADFLSVASWDNSVRREWPVTAEGKAKYEYQGPVLSVCWYREGNKAFSGGTDNTGQMFDTTTGQVMQVAQHDAPIETVRWVDAPQARILATGSWDKTIKY